MIKLPQILPRPDKLPAHLPETVKWLSGEGAGSWFTIEATGNHLRYQITRFSPTGMIECKDMFQSDKVIYLNRQYELTYPSHCSKVTVIQGKEIICFYRIQNERIP